MDIAAHSQEPIVNTVAVVNGDEFRRGMLERRVRPLVAARTLQQLYENLDPVARSLGVLGTVRYRLDLENTSLKDIRAIKTYVILENTRVKSPSVLHTVTNRDMARVGGHHIVHNRLGLGEQLEIAGHFQPKPAALGSGSLTATVPAPLGSSKLALQAFFLNQDPSWAAYELASHGLAAKLSVPWTRQLTAEVGVEATSRNVHTIGDAASDAVRATAGGSAVKVAAVAALHHASSWFRSTLTGEFALKPGDTQFSKFFGTFHAFRNLVPRSTCIMGDLGLSAGYIHGKPNILDNFVLGGIKDVYGVALNSMGPKSGQDFIGGQAFYNARATITSMVPGAPPKSPLRLTGLLCAGSLQSNGSKSPQENIQLLANSTPVLSAAAGLTYHTVPATFELLYVHPVQAGPSDVLHSGLHFGVGLSLA